MTRRISRDGHHGRALAAGRGRRRGKETSFPSDTPVLLRLPSACTQVITQLNNKSERLALNRSSAWGRRPCLWLPACHGPFLAHLGRGPPRVGSPDPWPPAAPPCCTWAPASNAPSRGATSQVSLPLRHRRLSRPALWAFLSAGAQAKERGCHATNVMKCLVAMASAQCRLSQALGSAA